jgi:zinc transport system substrate-binding protein
MRAMAKQRGTRAFVVVAALVLATGLPGCSRSTRDWEKHGGSPRIVVTIPALDNFVRKVGGDRVGVVCLCTTEGPHHYQDKAEDAILLRDADLFFAVGLTLDKFADSIQLHSHNPRLQYIKLGERLPKTLLQANEGEHEDEQAHEHEHEHGHEHGAYDPHVWLGIPQAIEMVKIIRDELTKADPNNEDDYRKNADAYMETLKKLHAYGKAKLKDKTNRKLIAFHESLGYFAPSFDLKIVDVLEVTPGSAPTPNHIRKLADLCHKEKVRVIATEVQYPKDIAEILQSTVEKRTHEKIVFAVVDPLETVAKDDLKEDGKELKSPDWYEKKMKQNLDNLAKALP